MGLFTPGRGPRSFDYEPRHYDPDEDENRNLRRRLRAGRSHTPQRSYLTLLIFVGLLLFTLYIYQAL